MDANSFLGVGMYVLAGLERRLLLSPLQARQAVVVGKRLADLRRGRAAAAPWILAFVVSPNVLSVLCHVSGRTLFWCYLFGAMWGVGGLTWGLMIRYLGVGLGLADRLRGVRVGGHPGPAVVPRRTARPDRPRDGGIATLLGVGIGVLGIILTGAAGISKERELTGTKKRRRRRVPFHQGHSCSASFPAS